MNKETVLSTEYSQEFDELRKNRMIVGCAKYGPIKENAGNKIVKIIPTLEQCLEKYKKTGNTEYLVDVANYAMIEFMYPQKEGAFYKATDDSGSAGIVGMSFNEILSKSFEG